MPMSDERHRPWVLQTLMTECGGDLSRIRHIVDVGVGLGFARDFYGPWVVGAQWTGIEVWEPYITRFMLRDRYTSIVHADVRELTELPAADFYILGDVLEHMTEEDAVRVWERVLPVCWRAVITTPVIPYPQGPFEGNTYETHVVTWDTAKVQSLFRNIKLTWEYPPTGAFWAVGERS